VKRLTAPLPERNRPPGEFMPPEVDFFPARADRDVTRAADQTRAKSAQLP